MVKVTKEEYDKIKDTPFFNIFSDLFGKDWVSLKDDDSAQDICKNVVEKTTKEYPLKPEDISKIFIIFKKLYVLEDLFKSEPLYTDTYDILYKLLTFVIGPEATDALYIATTSHKTVNTAELYKEICELYDETRNN